MSELKLSEEQQLFVDVVLSGKNCLVDACIGSGKTTAIQRVCDLLPSNLRILYLTYNKLLKLDAKARIENGNVFVTNYHGFAFTELNRMGIKSGVSDLVRTYNQHKPSQRGWDVLLLDEYQDLEQEYADMLEILKELNPNMQLVAVGDMKQKIQDKTTLDPSAFIRSYLGDYVQLEFTRCFRMPPDLAKWLGEVWDKKIIGVNPNCTVDVWPADMAAAFLLTREPHEILCLGPNIGLRNQILDYLGKYNPAKFNKHTCWSKISDGASGATEPTPESAIFTTFDGSKGMERDVCVICGFNEKYWESRSEKPGTKYEILRNIFCVAASRGKRHIIFVNTARLGQLDMTKLRMPGAVPDVMRRNGGMMALYRQMKTPFGTSENFTKFKIRDMFDFKFSEDVEACYNLLNVRTIRKAGDAPEHIRLSDGLIDLSPCVAIAALNRYFVNYDLERRIAIAQMDSDISAARNVQGWSERRKVLYYTSLLTGQLRYVWEARQDFVSDSDLDFLGGNLLDIIPKDAVSQDVLRISSTWQPKDGRAAIVNADGIPDAARGGIVYSIYAAPELSHDMCLPAAVYLLAGRYDKARVVNLMTGEVREIRVPDAQAFMDAVMRCITKGRVCKYTGKVVQPDYEPEIVDIDLPEPSHSSDLTFGVLFGDVSVEHAEPKKFDMPAPGEIRNPFLAKLCGQSV